MPNMKNSAVRLKNHVVRNKFAYAASGVALVAIYLQQSNLKAFDAFLESKGINPMEWYDPEMLVELSS